MLVWKQMQRGGFVWPPVTDGVVRLSAAQFAALFDCLDRMRLAGARTIHKPSAAAQDSRRDTVSG